MFVTSILRVSLQSVTVTDRLQITMNNNWLLMTTTGRCGHKNDEKTSNASHKFRNDHDGTKFQQKQLIDGKPGCSIRPQVWTERPKLDRPFAVNATTMPKKQFRRLHYYTTSTCRRRQTSTCSDGYYIRRGHQIDLLNGTDVSRHTAQQRAQLAVRSTQLQSAGPSVEQLSPAATGDQRARTDCACHEAAAAATVATPRALH